MDVDTHGQLIQEPHHEGTLPAVESLDIAQRSDVHKLKPSAVGLIGVLFLTVTGSAPISAMLFNTPISVGFGNGIGTPAGFIIAAIVLTVFGVAYVAMARKVTTAGGFYSFISHGLTRELGMASGFAMVAAYSVFEVSLVGGFAYFASLKAARYGVHIEWYWFGFAMIALIAVLAYFDVKLSSRILGAALMCEVLTLLVFDGFMFTKGNVSAAAINPVNAFKGLPAGHIGGTALAAGAAGIGIFFAFWSWVGWEMAPNYGEESRDPKKNVPRALYISVIGLGVFYALTSWAGISGYTHFDQAANVAQNNSAEFYFIPAQHYAGLLLKDLLSWFIITGSFACGMAFHNTTARYMYSLGRERVLHKSLGRTHPKHFSPHIASTTQSVVAAVILLAFALFAAVDSKLGAADSVGYLQVYGLMAVMGVVSILAIQALVSLAIFNYFRTHHRQDHHWWTTITAPLLAAISQAYVLYLAITNLKFLGSGYSYAKWLCWGDLVIFLGGLGYAYWLKSRRRAKYETIGRLINQGLDQVSAAPSQNLD
ncbi:MAG TPA: APC family permease [Solirubrobacteraceae bacterium]|nr:APC family permease [Solirubrobacteraceae bacterium]